MAIWVASARGHLHLLYLLYSDVTRPRHVCRHRLSSTRSCVRLLVFFSPRSFFISLSSACTRDGESMCVCVQYTPCVHAHICKDTRAHPSSLCRAFCRAALAHCLSCRRESERWNYSVNKPARSVRVARARERVVGVRYRRENLVPPRDAAPAFVRGISARFLSYLCVYLRGVDAVWRCMGRTNAGGGTASLVCGGAGAFFFFKWFCEGKKWDVKRRRRKFIHARVACTARFLRC